MEEVLFGSQRLSRHLPMFDHHKADLGKRLQLRHWLLARPPRIKIKPSMTTRPAVARPETPIIPVRLRAGDPAMACNGLLACVDVGECRRNIVVPYAAEIIRNPWTPKEATTSARWEGARRFESVISTRTRLKTFACGAKFA
jgi:hypothetical protein